MLSDRFAVLRQSLDVLNLKSASLTSNFKSPTKEDH